MKPSFVAPRPKPPQAGGVGQGYGAALSRAILAAALLVLAAARGTAGAIDDGLSGDRFDRAVTLALPGIYRLDVTIRIDGLATASGARVALPATARRIDEWGTAFAVAPDGVLATAAHLAAPSDAEIAARAWTARLALARRPHAGNEGRDWAEATRARPIGVRVALMARQATAGHGATWRSYGARLVGANQDTDLALVRIPARGAPALTLGPSARRGLPVVTLGFGDGGAAPVDGKPGVVPAVRRGTLGTTDVERETSRLLTRVSGDITRGDSGAPAVDADGRVRGVVSVRLRRAGGGLEPAASVAALLDRYDLRNLEGPAARSFSEGMRHLWSLDLAGARNDLQTTLDLFPAHTLAPRQLQRADALSAADYGLRGTPSRDGALLAAGMASALAALACGIALLVRRPPREADPQS